MKNFLLFYCFLFVSYNAHAIEYIDNDDVLCESFGDKDKDGIDDAVDNCPQTYNPHQDDSDRDGIGDVCDDDDCGCESEYQMIYVCQDNKTRRINCSALSDAITFCGPCESRRMDPCMTCTPDDKGKLVICHIPLNPENLRTIKGNCDEMDRYFNADGSFYYPDDQCGPCNCAMIGDVDTDGDGVCDRKDECPTNPNKKTAGMCGCDDDDTDKDWVCDSEDICPGWNDKRDADGDGVPDGCDICAGFDDKVDTDGDSVPDGCDVCPQDANDDSDGDGVCDSADVCAGFDDKVDTDGDSVPDGCDVCPQDANDDSDGDGVCNSADVCAGFDDKVDTDGDSVPDGCDVCPQDANDDSDGDGVCDSNDICPGSDDKADMDGDGIPDGCDVCPQDANDDSDGDGVCDSADVCAGFDDKVDTDGDSVPDGCDVCPQDANDDSDGDGVCDSNDICPGSDDKADMDGDGIPDGCDDCMMGDSDGDGVCDNVDVCAGFDDKVDTDGDSVPDGCDVCPQDADDDSDGDGVCDSNDVCAGFDDKVDTDGDSVPDGCDVCPQDANDDSDGDGVCDSQDCQPNNANFPATPGTNCNDGDITTDNDTVDPDGCGCNGTPIVCELDLIISDIVCSDNNTPADPTDDTYTFGITAMAIQNAGTQWEGSFSNAYLGAYQIGPTNYGQVIVLGPFPAGTFTTTNTSPPLTITDGMSIDIVVSSVGSVVTCTDSEKVDSPGTCACDDNDGDGVCDNVDVCPGFDDKADADGDQVPDGCDVCPQDANDDSDSDGVCDSQDVCPGSDDNADMDGDGIPDGCDECMMGDSDGDGVCDSNDVCAGFDDKIDTDGDSVPDGCDVCPQDANDDSDGDGVCDSEDICAGFDDNIDINENGIPDGCEIICQADAGRYFAIEEVVCFEGDQLLITAHSEIDPVVPEGFEQGFFLSKGTSLEPYDFNIYPQFLIEEPGIYTIHSIVLRPFDPEIDEALGDDGVETIYDFYALTIAGGGSICADIDILGARFEVQSCCHDEDGDEVCDPDDICPGSDDKVDTDGDSVPDGCDVCPQDANDDSDGDGVCDSNDICPGSDDKADMDGDGIPDGCDECMMGDSDGDGVCDNVDVCAGFDDKVDTDGDSVPDGCDVCPQDANDDSDGDGVCDSQDCQSNNPNYPAVQGTACDDGDPNTENDIVDADGCGCTGTPIACNINLIVSDIMCDDNDTPADASDDTYTFSLTAQAIQNAGTQWQGAYDNAYLGAAAIGPTNYGEKIVLGPFPAGTFTSSNTVPPVTVTDGLSINIQVNAVGGDATCQKTRTIDPPGTCACVDTDSDGVCDTEDKCPGSDDKVDTDGDGVPDGCDDCSAGDVDNDGVCDDRDICLSGDDSMDMDLDGVPDACDICPLDFFDDFDGDGICDFMDKCQGSDDNIDTDGDGVPDGCDFCPTDATNDSDGDGVCDGIDICPNGDDHKDTNANGIPDDCEATYCGVQGQSEYEWIENVTLDDVYISTGDDGGYGDYSAIEIEATRGDTLMIWLTAEYTEEVCELRHYAYADWNQDGDFDDDGEFLFLVKSLEETGANIIVPSNAILGKTRIRLFVTSGRLNGPCDPCFDGEAEDYTLIIQAAAETIAPPQENKETQTKANVEVRPNPVQAGTALRVDVNMTEVKNASVTLIDLDGNFILNQAVSSGTNQVPTAGLQPGIYILEYRGDNANEQMRVVIQD